MPINHPPTYARPSTPPAPPKGGILVSTGVLSVNDVRALSVGLPVPTMPRVERQRWTCTYCKGLRLGDSCEGCGAPRSAPAAPQDNPMPQPAPERR